MAYQESEYTQRRIQKQFVEPIGPAVGCLLPMKEVYVKMPIPVFFRPDNSKRLTKSPRNLKEFMGKKK